MSSSLTAPKATDTRRNIAPDRSIATIVLSSGDSGIIRDFTYFCRLLSYAVVESELVIGALYPIKRRRLEKHVARRCKRIGC